MKTGNKFLSCFRKEQLHSQRPNQHMQRPAQRAPLLDDAPHSPGMALSAKLAATASPAGSGGEGAEASGSRGTPQLC